MRIGILGGTFDPPHVGHLIVASEACGHLSLDRLLFVPAAVPPHKRGRVRTPAEQRLRLVRLAIAGDPRFEVDDLELRREGPSYSVDTLRELRRRHADDELFFLIGVDQLQEFHTWRAHEEIVRIATLAVVERGGEEPGRTDVPFIEVPVPRVDISATEIRRRVQAGEPIRYWVSEPVREAIEREGLYR